jgi:RNA polymerase sigma factor (sigma-70 family)
MVQATINNTIGLHAQPSRLAKVLAALPSDMQLRLREAMEADLEHVAHPSFKSRHAEEKLFAGDLDITGKSGGRFNSSDEDEFWANGSLAPTMNKQAEQLAFLRYNFARMKTSRFLREFRANPSRSRASRADFWYRRVIEARETIARANMALVMAMSKRTRMTEVDPSELISEGNMALLRAMEKFDVGRGFKFSTYACRAIIKAFSRAAMKNSRYRDLFSSEYDPGLESGDVAGQRHREADQDALAELRRIVESNSADLTDLERRVIQSRFSIGSDGQGQDAPRMTLREVGEMVGLTKERVRQIQLCALGKLRAVMMSARAA